MYRDARRPPPTRNPVALTGSASRASAPRRALQIALGALSWIGFGLLWMWQLEVYVPATWLYSICLIAIILCAWILFTIGWVSWNRNIYARRHRRTTPVRMEVGFERDSLGRPIKAPGGIRAAEGQVLISVDADGAKRYERERKPLPSPPKLPRWPRDVPAETLAAVSANGNGNGAANGNLNGRASANGNGNGRRNGRASANGNLNGRASANGNGNGRRGLRNAEWLLERAR